MPNETFLALQASEAVVAQVAATVYAAYLQCRPIDDNNEDEYLRKAVGVAVKLVVYADRVVKSDEEWAKPAAGPAPML
jgi:hypothetical protein